MQCDARKIHMPQNQASGSPQSEKTSSFQSHVERATLLFSNFHDYAQESPMVCSSSCQFFTFIQLIVGLRGIVVLVLIASCELDWGVKILVEIGSLENFFVVSWCHVFCRKAAH